MPPESTLAHRNVRSPGGLGYVSNQSPTVTDPTLIKGSIDILSSINGYLERRPGFANFVDSAPTTFVNLQRIFTWDDFDGNFYVMFSDVTPTASLVYKMQVGADTSAVLIYTDFGGTLPFEYVTSNGIVYFGNGHVMKKWLPKINQVWNWGIASGVSFATQTAGAGSNGPIPGTLWTNPNNVTSTSSFATVTPGTPHSRWLVSNIFGFAASTSGVTGIQISFTVGRTDSTVTPTNPIISVFLLKAGTQVGTLKTVPVGPNSSFEVTLGNSTDLWGTTWTGSDISNALWGVAIVAGISTFGSITWEVNNVQAIVTYGTPLVPTPTGTGTMSAYIGYEYVQCAGCSTTGHISSPCPSSLSTGTFGGVIASTTLYAARVNYVAGDTGILGGGNGDGTYLIGTVDANGAVLTYSVTANGTGYQPGTQITTTGGLQPGKGTGFQIMIPTTGGVTGVDYISVPINAYTDPQVDQIRVFRTTDSAAPGIVAQTFFELPGSPYPNTSGQVIQDSTADTSLNVLSFAPQHLFNDPPPPSYGFVYSDTGRVYMIQGANANFVWFTGLEEITNGVPEESVPSGIAGNFWKQDEPTQGLGLAGTGQNQIVGIFCGGRIYGISGSSLDTFQRFSVSKRRGTRNRTTISALGGMCGWFDTAQQIWATDGNSLQELSIPIRPDLVGTNAAISSAAFHTAGRFHWLVFSSGTQTFVYDIDQEQWLPPWSFAPAYLYSGETSPGNYQLMASTGKQAVALSTTNFNDVGQNYAPVIVTNLFSVVPDFGSRFSYIAAGTYDEPTRTGCPFYIGVDTNNTGLADVAYIADDDPTQNATAYTSIKEHKQPVEDTFNRRNGTLLLQNIYAISEPTSRWIGLRIELSDVDAVSNVYGWYLAYESKR